jgi:predicted O-methyltransferase YrrM
MPYSLDSPPIKELLSRLHAAADQQEALLSTDVEREAQRRNAKADSDLADLFAEAYIPVPEEVGRLLYTLARATNSTTLVEFGTSYGISTIYLAAAVRDIGRGRVITTEMNTAKARQATKNFQEAGLLSFIDVREGDALETLRNVDGPVDFVLLDGWKNLYLPVLKVIESKLRPGALIVADDLEVFPEAHRPYLDYVRTPENGYASLEIPIGDHLEISVRTIAS